MLAVGFDFNMIDLQDDDYSEECGRWIMFDENDPDFERVEKVIYRYSDRFVILCHGHKHSQLTYKEYNYFGWNTQDYTISFDSIVEGIKASPKWTPGMEVLLISCYAGCDYDNGEESIAPIAQRLAIALNTKVWAPCGAVYSGLEGELFVSEYTDIKSITDPRVDLEDQQRYWFQFYGYSW